MMPIRQNFASVEEFRDALRDWFAAQALNGQLASWGEGDEEHYAEMAVPDRMTMFAQLSYEQADAMLKAREQTP